MDILANPGIIFGIAGGIGLTVLGVGYGLVRLARHLRWVK